MTNRELLEEQYTDIIESIDDSIEVLKDMYTENSYSSMHPQNVVSYLQTVKEMIKGYNIGIQMILNIENSEN